MVINNSKKIPPAIIELLHSRGVIDEKAINAFLYPKLENLPQPGMMKNLPDAAQLIVQYILDGKEVIVWGDYDVDGTTSTALLVNYFMEYGFQAKWHIPNRLEEGYGLNIEWFLQFQKNYNINDFLVITVDCGISDSSVINRIQKMGGTVIVTDHHSLPESDLPDCLILNPKQKNCGFYNHHLAGVGVAFYLAAGVRLVLQKCSNKKIAAADFNLKQYLAFVALGTIADLVELTETNRILVRGGLEVLKKTKFEGLKALLSACEIRPGQEIFSEDIGFLIGPKINAAGRLGKPDVVVRLLLEEKNNTARRLASQLSEFNVERRKLTELCLESVLEKINNSLIVQNKYVIFKGSIHLGVAGIVASKLVDIFKVPALVFSEKTDSNGSVVYVGSARSIPGVSIIRIFHLCSEHIEKFGGHEMAAGLSVTAKKITAFEKLFSHFAKEEVENRKRHKIKKYDIICPIALLMSDDYLEILNKFEPYGPGNTRPVFF